jgi:hypothetical protein
LVYKILSLLRHTNVKMDQVCQDKSGRLGGVAGSVVLYVISIFLSYETILIYL